MFRHRGDTENPKRCSPTLGGVAAAGEAGVHRLAFELFGARAVAVEAPPSVLLFLNTYFCCGVSPGTP